MQLAISTDRHHAVVAHSGILATISSRIPTPASGKDYDV